MIAIGVLLIVASVISIISGTVAFGDIGVSMMYSGVIALLAGIGFLVANSRINRKDK